MSAQLPLLNELNARSREIFGHLVDAYVATGEPVGSQTLAKRMNLKLSAASVRNVVAELQHAGLLTSPHTSHRSSGETTATGNAANSVATRPNAYMDSCLDRRTSNRSSSTRCWLHCASDF